MILQKIEMTALRKVNKLKMNSKDHAFQTVAEIKCLLKNKDICKPFEDIEQMK